LEKFGTYTVFDLLIKYIKEGRIKLDKTKVSVKAAYHDPCNYGRKAQKLFGHGFFDEPRWILDQCLGDWIDLYPAKMGQYCCGGGGGTLVTGYDEERFFYGRKKMEQIREAGVTMIVVPCHSCHGQLNALKKRYEMEDLQIKYLWELVSDIMVLP
jgi:Fe-S oxidoreductase